MNRNKDDPVDLLYGSPKGARDVVGPSDGAIVRALKYVLVTIVLLPIVGGLLLVLYLLFGGGESLASLMRRIM